MRKGYTLILSTIAASLLAVSAMAMGPTISGVPDVYITQNTTNEAVPDIAADANMFRFSDALSLWDYVTTGSMDANAPEDIYWAYAIKAADYATLEATGSYLTGADVHYKVGTIDPIAPASTEGSAAWTAEINAAATQSLADADPLTFRNVRLSPLPDAVPYPAAAKDPATLPDPVLDFQEASLFVTDGASTPTKDTVFLVTLDGGADALSMAGPSGPTWTTEKTYANLSETANSAPVWDSFKYDVLDGNTAPGGITQSKTTTRLNTTASVAQTTPGPYGQWGPPVANEYTIDAAGAAKLWRFKVNMGSSNASTATNPMIRISLNGRTQGPGEGGREFAKNSGTGAETNGPTSAATKVFSTYLWPAAAGNFAPVFLVYDDDATRGGTIFVEANLALQSVPKADLTGGTVVVDQGQGAATGFVSGTGNGQWSASSSSFAGIVGYTGAPTYTSSFSSSLMTVGVSGTAAAGQGGLVKYGSSNLFTAQADKLYMVKARVAASTNTGAIPDLRVFLSAGNATCYHLQGRNLTAGSGPTTTPKDFVCVFETTAQNAGLWSVGMEAIIDPGQAGNLQISRVTVEEYPLPTE